MIREGPESAASLPAKAPEKGKAETEEASKNSHKALRLHAGGLIVIALPYRVCALTEDRQCSGNQRPCQESYRKNNIEAFQEPQDGKKVYAQSFAHGVLPGCIAAFFRVMSARFTDWPPAPVAQLDRASDYGSEG